MVTRRARPKFARMSRGFQGNVTSSPLVMAARIRLYALKAPGAYILGAMATPRWCNHPIITFNDDIIPAGCSW